MRSGQEEKKPQKMVRSSIACARCRRSKVKCELARAFLDIPYFNHFPLARLNSQVLLDGGR